MTVMTYAKAFEIVRLAMEDLQAQGWRFREGTARDAALAAVPQINKEAVCTAMMDRFYAGRVSLNPAWDGSAA